MLSYPQELVYQETPMQETLHRLTSKHPVTFERDNGDIEDVIVDPLIKQLREAIFGEDGRNGRAAESRARLPLSVPALDLYQEIDDWDTASRSCNPFMRTPSKRGRSRPRRSWTTRTTSPSVQLMH